MVKLYNKITYQGKPCSAGEYTRGTGFEPDFGYVVMDRAGVDLDILIKRIQWRAAGGPGTEIPGQVSMEAWNQIVGSGSQDAGENLDQAYLPPNVAGGNALASFGDLVFETEGGEPMRYSDVYIAFSGIEELTRGHAAQRAHNRGKIKIPLTDIRIHYRDKGALFCKINVRMKGGKPDRDTYDKKTKKPWLFKQSLRFLFSQLVGSPRIDGGSEVFKGVDQPAPEIVAEGEQTVDHLQRIFDAYGLIPQLLPTNHYRVSRRLSRRPVPALENLEVLRSDSRTIWLGNPPPLVMAVGSPVRQRGSFLYEAGFKDTNGLIYRLRDIGKVWPGYSYARLASEVFVANGKAFNAVPPKMSPAGGALHAARVAVLKSDAFKMYVPSFLFDGEKVGFGGVPTINDEAEYYSPFLPMTDCPIYEKDYAKIFSEFPIDPEKPESDVDGIKLVPPIVRANSIGEGFFQQMSDIKAHFDAVIESENRWRLQMLAMVNTTSNQMREVGKELKRAEVTVQDLKNKEDLRVKFGEIIISLYPEYFELFGIEKVKTALTEYDADLQAAMRDLGTPLETGKRWESKTTESTHVARVEFYVLNQQLKGLNAIVDGSNSRIRDLEAQFKKVEDVYKDYKGVPMSKMNLPYGVIAPGAYNINARTGILKFTEPHCHLHEPFLIEGDSGTVAVDGSVMVTYGFEHRENATSRLTSVLVGVRDAGGGQAGDIAAGIDEGAELYVCGVSRSSPIKAKVIKAAQMQLYKTERGTPMNLASVVATGFELAYGELLTPKKIVGHTYEMTGFKRLSLDGGVQSITHMWDGAHAYTVATVNSPDGRVPGLIAPKFKGKQSKRGAEIRVEIERVKE